MRKHTWGQFGTAEVMKNVARSSSHFDLFSSSDPTKRLHLLAWLLLMYAAVGACGDASALLRYEDFLNQNT